MYSSYVQMLLAGKKNELCDLLRAKPNDREFLKLLDTVLNAEMADELYKLSEWLVKNCEKLALNQDQLDQSLCIAVKRWRNDAIIQFLVLGANPNQEVVEDRNILDVCMNRINHSYSLEKKDIEESIKKLKSCGGKTFLESRLDTAFSGSVFFDLIPTYERWSTKALTEIAEMDDSSQQVWFQLLTHCNTKAKKPSDAWLKKSNSYIDQLGGAAFTSCASRWLIEANEPRKTLLFGDLSDAPYYLASDSTKESFDLWKLTDTSSFILKGLVWALLSINAKGAIDIISDISRSMYQPHLLLGSRDTKLASACFKALLSTDTGKQAAIALIDQTEHKPAIKKMKAILTKNN
jgi:hypothetical protein